MGPAYGKRHGEGGRGEETRASAHECPARTRGAKGFRIKRRVGTTLYPKSALFLTGKCYIYIYISIRGILFHLIREKILFL